MYKSVKAILNLLGIDLDRIAALRFSLQFLKDTISYRAMGGKIDSFFPIFSGYGLDASGGAGRGPYFHHDLLVAQLIFQDNPDCHVDVGSRIDGFVAHVASFRSITVFDVREMKSSEHPNISYRVMDFTSNFPDEKFQSVSCLNALEHFGLGRYRDKLDPNGSKKGFENISRMVADGGKLYLAVPIGLTSRVRFNAGRVFSIHEINSWLINKFELIRFDFVDENGMLLKDINVNTLKLRDSKETVGIFTLKKVVS